MRFSIDNRFSNVSLGQFRKTAHNLDSSLKIIRPKIESGLLLTTNWEDYNGFGSLTVLTPEVEEALARREKFQLVDLNGSLWTGSFKIEMFIRDNSSSEPYMICLSNEVREPKRLFFYGQCLDEQSEKVFESFRRGSLLQRVGDGYHHETSGFALSHALASLKSL